MFGSQFLQKAKLQVPWYLSFRSLVLTEKELKKNNDRIAIVRSARPYRIAKGNEEYSHIHRQGA